MRRVVVTVDPDKCAAEQVCSEVAPGMFELGPRSASRPTRAFTDDDLVPLREAELFCPRGAITVRVEAIPQAD